MSCADQMKEDLQVFYSLLANPFEGIDICIALHKVLLKDLGVIASDCIRAPGAQLDEPQRRATRTLVKSIL